MSKFKSLVCLALCTIMIALCGCSNEQADSQSGNSLHNGATAIENEEYGFQLELPEKGEEIAILHTSMGDISIRLFPQYAPKAVENFTTHIREGYYDGLTFHRVINDFMIQGGDPEGTGAGGESIWGESFEDEFCDKLNNIRGSLAMANSGVNTNGSQFFINQASAESFDKSNYDYDKIYSQYKSLYEQYCAYYSDFTSYYADVDDFIKNYAGGISPNSNYVPDEIWELYEQNGGNISLDGAWRDSGGHTVFGQVFDGLDVVDKIAKVETDDNDKPVSDVYITSAEIVKY